MTLDIRRASDEAQPESIIVMIYGDPGVGKTSLGFSAKDPLVLDFDQAAHRSINRGDSVFITSWEDVRGMTAFDLEPYSTIIVDTVGRALDAMLQDLIQYNERLAVDATGAPTLECYGALKIRFRRWIQSLRAYGKNIVLLAHTEESSDDGKILERPEIIGSSRYEVQKVCDQIGYIFMSGGERILAWEPSHKWIGKNPASLEQEIIPSPNEERGDDFLASILEKVRSSIGKISKAGQEEAKLLGAWKQSVEECKLPEQLTKLVEQINEVSELDRGSLRQDVKRKAANHAQEMGWTWNTDKKKFEEK